MATMDDRTHGLAMAIYGAIKGRVDRAIKDIRCQYPTLSEQDLGAIRFFVGGIYVCNPGNCPRHQDVRFVAFALAEAISVGWSPLDGRRLEFLFDQDKAFMKTYKKKYPERFI